MKVCNIALYILVLPCTVYGMQPQQKFYITSSDKVTIEVPQELIPYFDTFKTMQEDLGQEVSQMPGIPFNFSEKAIQFVLRLAKMVHTGGDIDNLMGEFLMFKDADITEIHNLLEYLDPVKSIGRLYGELFAERQLTLSIQAASEGGQSTTLTLQAGNTRFTFDKSLVKYMGTIQTMIVALNADLETITKLPIPSNSMLASIDPALFNILIEMLQLYHNAAQKYGNAFFDFQPILKRFLKKRNYSPQLLLSLLPILNYLDITILYEPIQSLIASSFERGTLKSDDPSLLALDEDNAHQLKTALMKPLLYEFQLIAVRKSRPKEMIKNVAESYISFSHNGLYACAFTRQRFMVIDLEKKSIAFAYDLPFGVMDCTMNDDGTLILIKGKEEDKERLYTFDVHNKTLNPIIAFTAPVSIKAYTLSPDNKQLCIITSQNRVLMMSGNKFANTVADFNFEKLEDHNCSYTVHWFPSSLKLVVKVSDDATQTNHIYIVGAAPDTYNTQFLMVTRDIDSIIAVPLDKNRLLIIRNDDYPSIVTFEPEQQVIPDKSIELPYNQVPRDLYDAVLSPMGKYALIFSEGNVDIMDVETGALIREFRTMFPAQFNKDDTGLWVYDENKSSFVIYPFRNAATLFLERILFKLNWPQLKTIINLCKAMRNKQRMFTGFSDAEKQLLLTGDYIYQKEMAYLERFMKLLQVTYDRMFVGESEESSSDEDTPTMDVD